MTYPKHDLKCRSLRPTTPQKQAILKKAKDIDTLRNRGRISESLNAEHAAIDTVMQSLKAAVVAGATRAEVIDIMNAAITFCDVHFADEAMFMLRSGYDRLDPDTSRKGLLAKFVAARRRACGEGISLAILDYLDLLHAFHKRVTPWERRAVASLRTYADQVLRSVHG